ncbi:MAG: SDR family oxidoreductase [Caldisericaceae bacterium]
MGRVEMEDKVAVIGATGHIGNTLSRILLKEGSKVVAIIPEDEDTTPIKDLDIEIRHADLRDYNSLKSAVSNCKTVYHTAGIVSIGSFNWQKMYEVNVVGAKNVALACVEQNVQRLVYTSSVHAIKEPAQGTTIDESLPFEPETVRGNYAKSKALATNEVLTIVREKGLDAVVVCPSGVIGPYDYKVSEMGTLILNIANGKMKFYIDGAYDFVDVRDVAQGIILAAKKGKKGESYILSGEKITVRELFSTVNGILGRNQSHIRLPYKMAQFASFFTPVIARITNTKVLFTSYSIAVLLSNSDISNRKAMDELGFTARTIKESLNDAINWFKERGLIR